MLTLVEVLSDFAAFAGSSDAATVAVNTLGPQGATPLHWMATLGDATAIRLLASAGANLDAVDNAGNTALHEAVISRQALAAEALLAVGADRDTRNTDGLSPQDMALQDQYEPTIALFAGK